MQEKTACLAHALPHLCAGAFPRKLTRALRRTYQCLTRASAAVCQPYIHTLLMTACTGLWQMYKVHSAASSCTAYQCSTNHGAVHVWVQVCHMPAPPFPARRPISLLPLGTWNG